MPAFRAGPQWLRVLAAALLLTAVTLPAGCAGWLVGPEPSASPVAIFDRLWDEIDRYYAHFPVKQVDWDALRDEFRPDAEEAESDGALFEVLCSMLERLQDGHVTLYSSRPLRACGYTGWFRNYRFNFFPVVIFEQYLDGAAEWAAGGRLTYGRLGPGTAYLHVAGFDGTGWLAEVDDVLAALAPFDALVLDVRSNGGGSSANADALAGRFADQRRIHSYVQYRNGPDRNDLTDPIARYVEPEGKTRFQGPVAVLTNRRCFSACESFVLAMDVLPNVTIVGDTTGGGLGNPLFRELQNGWVFRVPIWLQTTLEGRSLEGRGFAPHHAVQITEPDEAVERDAILDRALSLLGAGNG